ncbi:MAG: GTPase ObgE [Planctomycetes bacterium]|nr:GTPase ObgE [Planctomycetota bacterium]
MFRDEIEIEVRAGRGGDGLISFRREKSAPKGGPDGGDGGHGGSVILRASAQENSLLKLGRRKRYFADNGRPGGPSNKSGKSGEDLLLDVPIGTQVFDAEHHNLLYDLAAESLTLVVARGGRGGKGNQHFATSVRQTPRFAQPGEEGEKLRVKLELKLFAEVGVVGLPNAGKSTFLSKVTAATPKIADYPFTTLVPQVGIATIGDYDTLVIADLPGLIEGASEGAGLGHRFLKHVERCRVLLQLVDVSPLAELEPERAFRVVDEELAKTSPELHAKPRLVAASKCESEEAEVRASDLERALGTPVLRLSAVTGRGLDAVLRAAHGLVRAAQV